LVLRLQKIVFLDASYIVRELWEVNWLSLIVGLLKIFLLQLPHCLGHVSVPELIRGRNFFWNRFSSHLCVWTDDLGCLL